MAALDGYCGERRRLKPLASVEAGAKSAGLSADGSADTRSGASGRNVVIERRLGDEERMEASALVRSAL